jgi:hypothetical protein
MIAGIVARDLPPSLLTLGEAVMKTRNLQILLLAVAVGTFVGCGGGDKPTTPPTDPTLNSIVVIPANNTGIAAVNCAGALSSVALDGAVDSNDPSTSNVGRWSATIGGDSYVVYILSPRRLSL